MAITISGSGITSANIADGTIVNATQLKFNNNKENHL